MAGLSSILKKISLQALSGHYSNKDRERLWMAGRPIFPHKCNSGHYPPTLPTLTPEITPLRGGWFMYFTWSVTLQEWYQQRPWLQDLYSSQHDGFPIWYILWQASFPNCQGKHIPHIFSSNSGKTGFIKSEECKVSKNVTAIKNSRSRLFMVINVLTSFQLQKLQNPNANSSTRPQHVKKNTFIRKTAKRRKRRDIKSSLLLHFDNSFLFFCKINQSSPPCHSLKHWTCTRASQHSLPAWGTAAVTTFSSLAH